ncbi:MAG: hypothetical protein II063_10490 [Prevotella sp.]|nr:hypothetical protein [Prevotella sp.]
MEKKFSILDSFFDAVNLIGVKELRLNKYTVSIDLKRTIEAERFVVKSNMGVKAFMPALERLYEIKKRILSDCDYSIEINYLLNI